MCVCVCVFAAGGGPALLSSEELPPQGPQMLQRPCQQEVSFCLSFSALSDVHVHVHVYTTSVCVYVCASLSVALGAS